MRRSGPRPAPAHLLPGRLLPGILLAVLIAAGCGETPVDRLREQATAERSRASGSLEGGPLPALSLPTLDGDTLRLSDRLGRRATVVNFWATWCVPCREEMPTLVDLHGRYADRGVRFVGVAVASPDTGRIRDWIRRYDVSFPVLHDMSGRELMEYTGWDAVPTTLIVDGDGAVRRVMFGARSRHELVTALAPLVDR